MMKYPIRSLVMGVIFFIAPSLGSAEPYLRIVQPFNNYEMPPVQQSFVFGSVLPATATLRVNGIPVIPHTNGGFLAMIPFQPGKFEIIAVASDDISSTTVRRVVQVPEKQDAYPTNHRSIHPLSPMSRVVLRPGDSLPLVFQSAPDGTASFRMGGKGPYHPMFEDTHGTKGFYRSAYTIQPNDKFDDTDVLFYLKQKSGKKISKKAGAKITVQRRKLPRFIKTNGDGVLLTGPNANFGYHLFFGEGIQLEVTGEWGNFYRVQLGAHSEGWIKKSLADSLPAGTPYARSVSRNIRVNATDESTILEIPLKFRHMVRVEQWTEPHRLRLTLYGVTPDTDRIRYKSDKAVVKEIRWSQHESKTVTFDIETRQNQAWGYETRYDGTMLILTIRHQPQNFPGHGKSLKGLRVAVDAGHSGKSFGTIGPWGNTEATVNLLVAKRLKLELEKRGAEVVMIQDGSKELSLNDRIVTAWNGKAHLFLSIHSDATGEGKDPREDQGFSVHYYQPQSQAFARKIHQSYKKEMGINDNGLWRSNLAVCRMTQMPSILLELAFLIIPEFEERLMSPRFHKDVSELLVKAIISYMDQNLQ